MTIYLSTWQFQHRDWEPSIQQEVSEEHPLTTLLCRSTDKELLKIPETWKLLWFAEVPDDLPELDYFEACVQKNGGEMLSEWPLYEKSYTVLDYFNPIHQSGCGCIACGEGA